MKNKSFLELPIEKLEINKSIINKLKNNNISSIKEIWSLTRKKLKELNFDDTEIKQIIIQLQLNGFDLNKKIY